MPNKKLLAYKYSGKNESFAVDWKGKSSTINSSDIFARDEFLKRYSKKQKILLFAVVKNLSCTCISVLHVYFNIVFEHVPGY